MELRLHHLLYCDSADCMPYMAIIVYVRRSYHKIVTCHSICTTLQVIYRYIKKYSFDRRQCIIYMKG